MRLLDFCGVTQAFQRSLFDVFQQPPPTSVARTNPVDKPSASAALMEICRIEAAAGCVWIGSRICPTRPAASSTVPKDTDVARRD